MIERSQSQPRQSLARPGVVDPGVRVDPSPGPGSTRRAISSAALGDLARQRLSTSETFQFRARGLSMRPSIPDGALVTVAPVGPRGVRLGDVVLVFIGERASVHRVAACWAGLVWTKGDLNPWTDPPVPTASVVGRVVDVRHGTGHVRLDGPGSTVARVAWAALAWLPGFARRDRRPDLPGFV